MSKVLSKEEIDTLLEAIASGDVAPIYGGCSTEAEEKFGEGRILELREWWNEPAKVIKDNKVIAYGEILVMDESFGVRISEVVE